MCHLSNNGPAAAPWQTPALAPAPDNWRTPGPSGGPICAALLGQTCEFKLIRQVAWGAMRPNGSRTYSRVRFRFRVRVQVRELHILAMGGSGIGIGISFDLLHRLVVFWCCHLSFDLLLIACCLSPRLTSKVYLSLVRGFVVVIAIVVVAVAAFVV